ncbi:MAG: family 78 glycoside hydrolase catalytic domain [Bryobacterales bacterium]|nr:family 78 glycoside hydrolase catalytic domain [Bryobacterales bacterium]
MKLLLFLIAGAAVAGAAIMPYALECEARRNPMGIDSAQPRLGWKLKSAEQNQSQSAYQIVVAGDAGEVWDSGRVASAETTWIGYSGKPLASFQRYRWKVRVWDAKGVPSEYSDAAEWTMSIAGSDWRARWISHPDHVLRSGPLPLFRKEVMLEKPLRRAIVLVAGVGFHELRINGSKVGDHVLAPAWTNYRATVNYETFDVTAELKPGANALGVMLGNGFYNVAGGRYTKYTGSFGHPRLALQLHLEFADGTAREVTTDATWRAHEGPITFSCIYGGEDYDARLELPGWDTPGYNDAQWSRVTTGEAPGGLLRAQASPPVKVQRTLGTTRVTEPKPGVKVYDLGLNFAGWPKLTVHGPAGAAVKMIPGELLTPEGLVTQRSSGGPTSFSYTLKGSGTEVWTPRFTYYGFRYVQVETTATVGKLEGEFVYLDAPRAGTFSSSNELFDRIHTLIDTAVRSNLQHSLTDCPHREKLGWLEVSHLMGASLLYNWDLRTFLPKVIRDVREAQTVDGLIPSIAPEYVTFGGAFRDSPEWGSAGVILPWLAWQWYGDRQTLAFAYPMMKRYNEYLGTRAKDGLLTYGLGDWYDIGPGAPGNSKLTPLGITASATWWADLKVLEGAAQVLGKSTETAAWAAQAGTLRQRFQEAFYQPAGVTYGTGSQTSLAMPLALGMAPVEARGALAEKLVADIRARGNHTSAGDVGYSYVLSALTQAGRGDAIFDMAANPEAPSYAAQLSRGATSLTEAWDANPASSQNHLMLGHIVQWFYAGLAGIRPDGGAPAARHVVIQPEPAGDVRWVKAAWESVRGPVKVDWRLEGGAMRLSVEIPPGMTADVRLPGAAARAVGSGRHDFTQRR